VALDLWSWLEVPVGYGEDTGGGSGVSAPGARVGHQIVFDPLREEFVLFGGWDGVSSYYSDTWVYRAGVWRQLSPTTTPTARYGHAMCWDPVTGQVLMFGGRAGGALRNDLMAWDGDDWSTLISNGAGGAPAARLNAMMAVVHHDEELVLFGGWNNISTYYADTYTVDLSTTPAWTSKSPATSPGSRHSAGCAYDYRTGLLYVLNGTDSGGAVSDLYSWDGTTWADVTPGAHLSGDWSDVTMRWVYDQRRVVVIGSDMSGSTDEVEAYYLKVTPSTWIYSWVAISTGETPWRSNGSYPDRPQTSALRWDYDPQTERIMAFGPKAYDDTKLDETWELKVYGLDDA
jgi:hypothetical protein